MTRGPSVSKSSYTREARGLAAPGRKVVLARRPRSCRGQGRLRLDGDGLRCRRGRARKARRGEIGRPGRLPARPRSAPAGSSVYVVAKGGTPEARPDRTNNAALALLAVLGATPPKSVTINEFTTVASVWTNAQFLDGDDAQGPRARAEDRRRQRAELRRPRDRRVGQRDPGSAQQHRRRRRWPTSRRWRTCFPRAPRGVTTDACGRSSRHRRLRRARLRPTR